VTTPNAKLSHIAFLSAKLTVRRLRAHAALLAICLCGTIAYEYSVRGIFDRAGNIKFQDFLQFPISASLIAQGRADQLYNDQVLAHEIHAIVGRDSHVFLQYFHGPQVALPFIPLLSLPYLAQAAIWAAISVAIYFTCVWLLWKHCAALRSQRTLVVLCALAYPPLFHFFVRGQLSVLVLACFTVSYFAFAAHRDWLAGATLGCLAFKPQFLVAIPLILLFAQAWKALAGLLSSAAVQLILTSIYFGRSVMQAYFTRLLHSGANPSSTELTFSAVQMHSLYSFSEILIPWHPGVWALYLTCSVAVITLAAAIWKSSSPLSLRFAALSLAAVLVNPHIYIYDLLVLAPVFLLLVDWSLVNSHDAAKPPLDVLLYLAFLLPLFGPLAYWTHLQLSVAVFAAILWTLYRIATASHKLAFTESAVV
jgi:hypothetical protein